MKDCRYNYIILGSELENYRYAFQDVSKLTNAKYIYDINAILGKKAKLFFPHISKRGNHFFSLPFKSIWNKYLVPENPFNDDKPLCFIIFGIWRDLVISAGLGEYLKCRFPGSKTILFLQDILEKSHSLYSSKPFNADELKSFFDYVISYDQKDCDKYGFIYHPTVFSVPDLPLCKEIEETDLYFLGRAKGRFPLLLSVYNSFTKRGLKCDFFVSDVSENDQIVLPGMHYIKGMSYTENLQRISKTRCILELMQEGAVGYTFRLWESIVMNKKLLTNNKTVITSHFYNTDYIALLQDPGYCDIEWIKKPLQNKNHYVDQISPKELLKFIDRILLEEV